MSYRSGYIERGLGKMALILGDYFWQTQFFKDSDFLPPIFAFKIKTAFSFAVFAAPLQPLREKMSLYAPFQNDIACAN